MSKNKSASIEARLKNSRDLIISIKNFGLYDPSLTEIKKENYEEFVNMVDTGLTPYKDAISKRDEAARNLKQSFMKMQRISKTIKSEVVEASGNKSDESLKINSIIKILNGSNISEHSKMKRKILSSLKEGDPKPEFTSVSALDYKSRLGNFRLLISQLRRFGFYNPTDASITIASLEAMEAELTSRIAESALADVEFTNERSRIIHYFTDENGLADRANRARMHIRRKYGSDSPEYKLISGRRY